MIKIFRHIRISLINENNMGKYFKYAIGEILLVVVGILIALQINNWNEDQKTKKWEKRFLIDLQNELKNDYAQLTEVYDSQMIKGQACAKVLKLIETIEEKDKRIIDSIYGVAQFGNMTFFPTTGVYDSGMSAGKIENLQNDSLKYTIMNLYNHFYKRLVYNGEVLDDVIEKVDWEKRVFFDEAIGEIKSWESIHEFEFRAQIRFMLDQNIVYTNLAEKNIKQVDNVIKMITHELNK